MSNENPSAFTALLEWFRKNPEAADVLPSERLNLAHRILTNCGPHALPEQWAEALRAPRKQEQHLFREGAHSPDARIAKLKKMRAPQRLDEANRRGGNK